MRFLAVAFLVASPAVFAQGRGGGRSVGPVRGPVRVTAPAPLARPVSAAPIVVPYPVYFAGYYPNPYYYGSGYATSPAPADYGYDPSQGYPPQAQGYPPQGYPPQAYQPQGQGYPAQSYPSVIVNPNYTPETANPVLRDYTNVPVPEAVPQDGAGQQTAANPPSPSDTPQLFFLIAMKDHAIYPALAYWVEDNTLNYISQQGVRNRVSLDLVDRDFSTQLNKERNIDFGLPPSK